MTPVTATMHKSHDAVRLDAPRRRDLAPLPAGTASEPVGGRARPFRGSRHAVLAALRAGQAGVHGEDARELASRVLTMYRGAILEVGAGGGARGPSVHSHAVAWATHAATAQLLAMRAAAAGIDSDRGLALVHESQRASGRAERCWTQMFIAAGLLRGRGAGLDANAGAELAEEMRAAAQPREAPP